MAEDIRILRAIPQANRDATVAPTVTDDTSKGYVVDSSWVDVTADKAYICLDPTIGAAVWRETTGMLDVVDDLTPQLSGDLDCNGHGITEATLITLINDKWFAALNYATSDFINMFKVNVDDAIDVGGSLNVGSLEAVEDSGAVTLVDMPVSDASPAGAEMSFTHKLNGSNIFKVYAEADSAGGIQSPSVRPNAPIIYDQAPQVLTGAGAVDVVSAITHIVTTGVDALTLADGVEGQIKFIVMKTDVNTGTLTPTNLGNGSTITFDDVGDSAHLLFTNAAWHFMGGTATLA